MAQDKKTDSKAEGQTISAVPSISLPKGGGAIRGMGEKFAANPVTGTGSIVIPIGVSPGRSGYGPQLSLSYDSGSGNGPFGFGWSVSLPYITRKTDKGLPQYLDAEESDVFILSGAEDLVPMFRKDAEGNWVTDERGRPLLDERPRDGYLVRRYRPRIEGLFARIERWTNEADPTDVHWRSFSRDNILTIYGKNDNSRIADPTDITRIFSWLICETRDDQGNAVVYEYKPEDGARVDLTRANERNRGDRDDPKRTANRYLKRIRYGNRTPLLNDEGKRPRVLSDAQIRDVGWMFEVVFDYGEHDAERPGPRDVREWSHRSDAFSSYRAGFEVRTCRLCQRVLMFHHFADEPGVGDDCLVRSTDFAYSHQESPDDARTPVYTFLVSITQTGYKRNNGGYLKGNLPSVEFEYTKPIVRETVEDVNAESLENLPAGLDGAAYRWADLHGEGIPGILSEQGGGWFYKRNLSPINILPDGDRGKTAAKFAPLELVDVKPNLNLAEAQLMDLAGDGQPDLVMLNGPTPGLYEHDDAEGWRPFRTFTSPLNRDIDNPNLRFIDLDGDGLADVLVTEENAFIWHPSFGEQGFGPARQVWQALDEEKGPQLVFAERNQSVYLADLSGDGLTDLVRIRNGEVCYWPNLGYGRFGAKVTMDNAPRFDYEDHFDPSRIRLADIDGSGSTDIIYLHASGVRLYFNQSGNSWSAPQALSVFPQVDDLAAISPIDLLGNGTACLVWSSPLSADARRQMRYVDLMGGQKPHLLIKTVNSLGAEMRVQYSPSTKSYLQDKRDGRPWITRLPFPVHVVERVETYDHINHNRFITQYTYHHGYFDGDEREFRGFGLVEQKDTEEFDARADAVMPEASNLEAASHVPPVLTRSWFHTGVYVGRDHVSDFFAGFLDSNDKGEYYREPGLTDAQARALLLPDTVLPAGLTIEEEREACRALKGAMLRQEVYALDNTPRAEHPYVVSEQNFTVRHLQPRGGNPHAVFFVHAREVINYSYERNPADPRNAHAMTLEVDDYGNTLKEVAIAYGRRQPDPELELQTDRDKQSTSLVTYTENSVTNPIDDAAVFPDDYRTPLAAETRTYELTGYNSTGTARHFQQADFVELDPEDPARLVHIFEDEIDYENSPDDGKQRRLIEHVRALYRPDDLGEVEDDPLTLLPLRTAEPLAVAGESYKLAFTPGLLEQVFQRDGQPLIPDATNVLGGGGASRGGYIRSQELKADGRFPNSDPDDYWWIPSGRVFLSADPDNSAAQELAQARQHFFLPRRYRDPFHTNAVRTETVVTYDAYDLLTVESRDPLGNRMTVGERLVNGEIDAVRPGNDYRVLQPWLLMDPNRNRAAVSFDALGMVVGTALMGKPEENQGDSLEGFDPDLNDAVILNHITNPLADPHAILGRATSRLVYDVFAFQRTRNDPQPQPGVVYGLMRETHASDLELGQQTRVQHSFSYSDGFGREIQKKIQAEPERINSAAGPPRWVSTGWTIFNNKGKPVRQYEPFFSATHNFEFGVEVGVSPVLFYDPVGRVVATLHPNHTYEKVVFDAWRQLTYDVNDTVAARNAQTGDPRTDPDVQGYMDRYFAGQPADWQTWHALRQDGAVGADEQIAATKAAVHADTPVIAYLDTLSRVFLTVAENRFERNGATVEETYATRVEIDVEGNERVVRDAIVQNGGLNGRLVMQYDYDMLRKRIRQSSMETGEQWIVSDAANKPIRAWDSRAHNFRSEYDPLRRPMSTFVTGADPANPDEDLLIERILYGEQHPEDELRNLRGKMYLHLSQVGAVANEAHDFKGNPLRSSRRLSRDYKHAVDWSAADAALPVDSTAKFNPDALEEALTPNLEDEVFISSVSYDALNRPVLLTTPHTLTMPASVIRMQYNEASLLDRVDANVHRSLAGGQSVWTPFVTNIDYDSKGQRLRLDSGNGASTFYEYDALTFRLVHLTTRRNAIAFPDDCPQPAPAGWPGCRVQNLHYTYDPIGNITHIRDDAQQTIYFRNKRVEPSADYTYDAVYRLVEATGREHLGQLGAPIAHSHDDAPRVGIDWAANDGNAIGGYIERYVYDAVGNILEMQHRGSDPVNAGWTRRYTYNEPSLLEPAKQSNRLSSTTVGNGDPVIERYVYDAHGNMIRMPHLGGAHPAPNMHWDYRNQLTQTNQGGGGTAYYVYDATGQRVRKVWEKAANLIEERIYLGGLEIFRRRNGAGTVVLERETLQIMDDKRRLALVETRTVDVAGDDPAPERLIRYQLGNHLGSASLELDGDANIISYEEYTPYGSTSYQAVHSRTETPKRYRYTGKERDGESGFYYHGERHYVSWLGRWCSPDPISIRAGLNLYEYSFDNPLRFSDLRGLQPRQATEEERGVPPQLRSDASRGRASIQRALQLPISYTEAVAQARAEAEAQFQSQGYADYLNVHARDPEIVEPDEARRRQMHWNEETDRWESSRIPRLHDHPAAIPAFQERYSELSGHVARIDLAGSLALAATPAGAEVAEARLLRSLARVRPTVPSTAVTTATTALRTARVATSSEGLVARVRELHRQVIIDQLSRRGVQATEALIGRAMGQGTISIVEAEVNGQVIRVITTNNPGLHRHLYQFRSQLLREGETLGSRPIAVYGPVSGQRQYIHAEQVGVQDVVAMGAREGTVATSNAGCNDLCISMLEEFFPTFRHLNPRGQ